MTDVFLKIADLGVNAGFLILAVLVARLLLSRAPKSVACLLWALVALRLVVPIQIQSSFSLVPNLSEIAGTIAEQSANAGKESDGAARMESIPRTDAVINTDDGATLGAQASLGAQQTENMQAAEHSDDVTSDEQEKAQIVETNAEQTDAAAAAGENGLAETCAVVWMVGVGAMLCYLAASYLRLRYKTSARVCLHGNVYVCDEVESPFILGAFRPEIFIPSGMEAETTQAVLRHERAHIRRRDPLWKLLGFLLLSVYWFCPLCWVAYLLFCRDIEFACDERAVLHMDGAGRAEYCQALLDCSSGRRSFGVCPVAFGEISVKKRIRAVADYRKPTFWVILGAAAVCVIVAVCFFTSPRDTAEIAEAESETAQTETEQLSTTEQSLETAAENSAAVIDPEEAENTVRLTYGETTLLEEEENAALYQNVRNLLAQRDTLHEKLMSAGSYVDDAESITVTQENGTELIYYRVTETDSWDFYENQALELYGSDYVANIFTPFYIGRGIFTEEDARLYRQLSDTPYDPILTETVQIWKLSEGDYAVSAYEENDSGYDLYLFRMADAPAKTYGVELLEEERYSADAGTTAVLSFEELIAMVNSADWNSFVAGTDADYWRGYTNFTEDTENDDIYDWLIAEYWFNGRPYRVQISCVPDATNMTADFLLPKGSIDSIYLTETDAGDVLLLYRSDRTDFQPDIDSFLAQSYDIFEAITMDQIVIPGAPTNAAVGLKSYTVDLFLGFDGCLFDFDLEIAHGDSAPESWYSAGGIAVMEGDKNQELAEYDSEVFVYDDDGKLTQVNIWGNHMGYAYVESFETEDFTGLLYEHEFELYTLTEMGEEGIEEDPGSEFWTVFLDSGEDEPTYVLFFNKLCFSKEQALAAAQTVQKR